MKDPKNSLSSQKFKTSLLLTGLLLLILSFSFSGCGKEETATNPTLEGEEVAVMDKSELEDNTKEGVTANNSEQGHERYGSYEKKDGQLYFIVKELGIKFPVLNDAEGQIVYFYDNIIIHHQDGSRESFKKVLFSNRELLTLDKASCDPLNIPCGAVYRYEDSALEYPTRGINLKPTYYEEDDRIKKFDGFFVVIEPTYANCLSDENEEIFIEKSKIWPEINSSWISNLEKI